MISGTGAQMQSQEIVNILMVDDRQQNLLALEAVLGDMGQNLVRANSGREALKHLLDQEFALILLDVQMPGLDGYETAALAREREQSRHTPIIFLTAINQSDAQVFKGYSSGAVDYMFKPFVPEVLRAKVSVFVELYRSTQEVRRQAELLQRANAELEAQGAERLRAEQDRVRLQEEVIRMQAAMLEELSTPLIPLSDAVVIMPLVGTIDARRAEQILAVVSQGVVSKGARVAIIDITGVPTVDTHVASVLIRASQAVRLLGAEVVLTGIRSRVAQALVELGVDLGGLVTRGSLQAGITYAQSRL